MRDAEAVRLANRVPDALRQNKDRRHAHAVPHRGRAAAPNGGRPRTAALQRGDSGRSE